MSPTRGTSSKRAELAAGDRGDDLQVRRQIVRRQEPIARAFVRGLAERGGVFPRVKQFAQRSAERGEVARIDKHALHAVSIDVVATDDGRELRGGARRNGCLVHASARIVA